jgi:chromosome condensin MukBEF MukE localization factor
MLFTDKQFVDADVRLRRGGHVTTEDVWLYEFLTRNFGELQQYYAAYGSTLIQHEDSFFFLQPHRDGVLRTRELSKGTMLVGQAVALLTRDPETTKSAGLLSQEMVLQVLESLPVDTLRKTFVPKRREATLHQGIRDAVAQALRQLSDLDFIRRKGELFFATSAINRFMELARHGNDPDDDARTFLTEQRGVVFESPPEESEDGDEANDNGEAR